MRGCLHSHLYMWVSIVCQCFHLQSALCPFHFGNHLSKEDKDNSLLDVLVSSKTCIKWPLSKRLQIGFQDQLPLNAGQNYCRMLKGEHSAILSTIIKLPFVIKLFVLSFLSGCFTQVLLCHSQIKTDSLVSRPVFSEG